ncbi:MAG TPA: CFI-box-CTERM domain-containing protein [Polyangia bacterium]|nr:CFI-box-CTERM domain-containing protein [Polyangia bacterium]
MRHAGRLLVAIVCGATLVALHASEVSAAGCTVLDYTFQPDCFRAATDSGCTFDPSHPDMGPQIAVWLESADGTQFVDTLLVTNAVAVHGIGNRPGTWDMLSGPRFPYGRRPQALPIWAHARGELYQFVAMNDGMEDEMAYHENISSPEPYFCRPMAQSEIVDAVTCPSGMFRSAKGLFDSTQPASYYPPRADLFNYGGTACFPRIGYPGSCDAGDSAQYFAMNDVDVVAAATPPYGAPFTGSWVMPADLPAGDYRLAVEVGKEFDTNAANQHPNEVSALDMTNYPYDGQANNVGQPSVVFRVPFTYGPDAAGTTASATDIAGYGDWTGTTGVVNPPDATISADPGSGAGRLLPLAAANGARVALSLGACAAVDCNAPSALPLPVSFTAAPTPNGTGVTLSVLQSSQNGGQPVVGYQTRYTFIAPLEAIDASSFSAWTAAGEIPAGAPDSTTSLQIDGLTPLTDYAVGISAVGSCGDSPVTFQRFETPAIPYAKLTGCFIATAAFGSDLDPEVATLRALRDAATTRSAFARTTVDLYYRSSPPLASVLTRSPTARALVRTALRAITR